MDLSAHSNGRKKHSANMIYTESLARLIENVNFSVIFFNIFSLVMVLLSKISIFDNSNEEIIPEDKSITSEIFNFLFLLGTITLGFASNDKRSLRLLTGFIITLIIINFNLAFGQTKIFDITIISVQSSMIKNVFYFIFFSLSFSISFCLIIEFLHSKGYTRKFDSDLIKLDYFIKETKTKLDLIKIRLNSFIVTFGLRRYLPFMLFKKRDFYFMADSTDEKGKDEGTNYNKLKCADNEDELINSLSTIDSVQDY